MRANTVAGRIVRSSLSLALTGLVLAPPVFADLIHLHDGTKVEGERIVRSGDGWDIYFGDGKKRHVMADAVKSIELRPKGDPAGQAVDKLGSLRRSVDALTDLKQIVARYETFVEQNKALPIVEDAKKDLATWKDRQARGMVKAAGRWMLPEERTAFQVRALVEADEARELMKQNRVKDAEAAVEKALAGDPANASALYLKGLILFRQDKIPQARAAFEEVKKVMPDHGPTLNNLAIIQWRQNQQIAALNTYLAAMQAMPMNKELLNNVAEALNALPEKDRAGVVPQKVYKLWTEQDTQLQQQMMPLGWFRWGGTWVDRATHEKLQAAEKEVKDKVTKLETEFAEAQGKINTIDAQIRANRDAMAYMERTRFAQDATGKTIAYPLPPQYYDYDRANRRLEVQRQEVLATIDRLRATAAAVKTALPAPKFTGVQVAVGVEGTPAIPPSARAAAGEAPKPAAAPVEPAPAAGEAPGNLLDAVGGGTPPATAEAKKPADKPLKY
ncbi:MAG: tetratricopeptide repeat protein [Phycisphaerae bacterium]|nr:tetratricopeptide repeat protein [Tepidisphaeraceae bacterium]